MITLKRNSKKIILAVVIVLIIGTAIAIICAFQRGMAERPSLEETRSIRLSIEGFTRAKDLKERMVYVTKSAEVQKKMRSYLVIPFTKRKILAQEIRITQFSEDPKSNKKKAVVQQKLTYFSEADSKTHKLQTTFKLEKHQRWLISDFQTTVIRK